MKRESFDPEAASHADENTETAVTPSGVDRRVFLMRCPWM